ncbi:MAG TPA: RHS repeat-associated core domain-containing protein [Steroidobacteraceae bacterium]|nr:RHS repeat-associated core domain-containing protein [Steroidobacteraceae bacterium]
MVFQSLIVQNRWRVTGLETSRAYDGVTHWLSSVESGPSGSASIQNQSFLYDEVGNVTQRQDNNRGLSENFYYDSDNRLSYSTLNGTQNVSLNYNGMGNITSRSDVAGGATWTYDSIHVHEVTQAGSTAYAYAYDANGNVTSRQGSSIGWSSYNYPTAINDTGTGESVSFLYGPDRRAYFEQTQSSSGTETNYHVGGLLDIVTSGGVTDYRHYVYAGGELVAINSRKSTGVNALHYVLSDHQGSVAAITDTTGAVVVGESFTAYGNRRNPSTWSGAPIGSDLTTIAGITRQGYTLQDALGQMGLNDMVGRVQDAITGRFLSADPSIPDPMDPQSYNRYSYTRNNPLTYTDPSGFADDCKGGDPCMGGSSDDQIMKMEGFVTVYSGSTYTYVTDQENAQGPGGGTQTVTDVFQGNSIVWNAQGGMSNLLGSYHNGQWNSSGLDDTSQGDGWLFGVSGSTGVGAFAGGFGRFGGGSSGPVGVLKGSGAPVAVAGPTGPQQGGQSFHNRVCRAAASLDDAGSAPHTNSGAISMAGGALSNAATIIEDVAPAAARVAESVGPVAGYAATATSAVSAVEDYANGNYEGFAFEGVDTVVEGVLSSWGPLGATAAGIYQLAGGSEFIAERALTGACAISGGS